jgi:hypothetical protein
MDVYGLFMLPQVIKSRELPSAVNTLKWPLPCMLSDVSCEMLRSCECHVTIRVPSTLECSPFSFLPQRFGR